MTAPAAKPPLRLLIVLPSWVGDAAMATPTLRIIRDAFPGVFIGALARPGIDQVLAGAGPNGNLVDEFHVERAQGMMGPKLVANKVRPRRYDAAFLLPNSLSSALIVRLAGIPKRIGYARDGRGLLLTSRIDPPREVSGPRAGKGALVSPIDYYHNLAAHLLLPLAGHAQPAPGEFVNLPHGRFMELHASSEDEAAADAILAKAGIGMCGGMGKSLGAGTENAFAILNPGGNNPEKRWPADRFAQIGRYLQQQHGLAILVNGSPNEAELCDQIVAAILGSDAQVEAAPAVANLARLGNTLGSLKALTRRARLMVTNDTGPRHIAAAFGTPLVSLFGPTDHRWTTIPTRPGAPEIVVPADPTLPESEVSNDHPERCRIDRIEVSAVREAVDRVLAGASVAVRTAGVGSA